MITRITRITRITGFDRLRRSVAACAIAVTAGASNALAGEDASPWDGDARSAVRLIAGSSHHDSWRGDSWRGDSWREQASASMLAGIEIRLKPGWHTYWRYPGDAGVPPRFDFTGSRNVKAVTVLWPAPQRIPEQGLSAIGYAKDVILALLVVPADAAAPITLRLKVEYAVCEKLCVPAQGTAQLALAGGHSSLDAALSDALSRVPRKRALGEGSMLAIRSVRREVSSPRPRVLIDVAAPVGAGVELFAEGPSSDWALPLPVAAQGAPAGLQRFAFDLDGAPPGAKYEGAVITITAVAAHDAIEVIARLD